ncbi:ABC transporter substrate-binding protein [Microbacterium esteraromaticum]|uniref:ABC transporter substrate-binding protein n=1 Tax=Microbacterium esteraromaticum TaxID=57043 RepID=A0A7D8ABY3_9MICO|nr:ABC transporter substrate-binding protein [Microbacterium esteraromaticum]QMU97004.1 ABC transporter substrate-binding protein [Microbacterium esteraromaticum]
MSHLSAPARVGRSVAAVAGIAALALLTACSGGSETPASDGADVKPLESAAFQLGWIPNVESMAPIVASARGYFEDEGVDVELLPGGPEVTTDAQIVSGNALVGSLSSEGLANSVRAGAPLVAIGAIYQTSSSAIITTEASGISEPKDLEGRRFGISQTDARVYTPFFSLNGVDETKIDEVSTGSDPASLISGEVDAMSGTLANQPIALEAAGVKTKTIRLADYGYNRWSQLLVVRKDSLEDPQKRATVEAMLKAITKGLEESVADPDAAAQTVYDVYGEQLGLELDQQKASAAVWAELAANPTTDQGLVQITEEGIQSQQEFFDTIGIEVDAADLFDLSVQEEGSR